MTRVYAIRAGSYSDTSWGPVFSTVEKAVAYVEEYGDTTPSNFTNGMAIEIHVLDDENDTGPVYPEWIVVFDRAGNVISHRKSDEGEPYEERLQKAYAVNVPPASRWYFLDGGDIRERAHIVVRDVYAPTLEYAIKIASEKRTQFMAVDTQPRIWKA